MRWRVKAPRRAGLSGDRTRETRGTTRWPQIRWTLVLILLFWSAQGLGQDGSIKVRRVIDGDTILLEDGREVRYVGINTPERGQAFFEEARALNRRLVEGKWVRLERDQVLEDKHGRLLAYVYIDGEMVNERLLEAGLAHLLVIPPNLKHYDRLLDRQRQARSAKRGMWQRLTRPLRITSLEADSPGDDRQRLEEEYVRIANVTDEMVDLRGFTLTDRSGHRYIFPSLSLKPGYSVLLLSGRGRDLTDPKEQIVLHWQFDGPIWNNEGDTATLRAPDGSIVDTFRYRGRRREGRLSE